MSNGTLNIAGKYYAVNFNNLSKFTISGGNVIVPSIASTNTTFAPFQIDGAGSQFNMSGGSLIIPREGGTGTQDLGFVNTGTSAGSVTGGTLQIGSSSSPSAQIIQINSNYPVGNLLVNSSNVTASLLTNSLSVINDIAINTGTLSANSFDFSLGRNWINNGGTFLAGTGSVIFSGTLPQTIFKSGGETFNHISFSNAGMKTLLSPISANNVVINSSSVLDVNTGNFQVSVKGNLLNSGTFKAQKGLVLLNGTATQTIGGTSTTDFYNLTLNNTAGATLTNAENLVNTLTLNNGMFNTNGKVFTMVSTAANTARIAQITGTGDITGNVTVQRYAPGGYTGWALLGTPISSPLTFQDWDDNMPISCASCPDGSAGGFVSIYSYDETAVGSNSAAASYIPMNAVTDPIVSDKGYWVYLGTGYTNTTPITIDVTGTVRKFNNAISLIRTNTGSPNDDGWNLIHNPYPSPIKWSLLKGATANVDNAIYVYNADLNGGLGAHASFVNGVSSPAIGSGGISDTIPMCQGFYVHCTASAVLNATEANKVAGNPAFLRSSTHAASVSAPTPLIRLYLDGMNNYHDETVVYLQPGAGDGFDAGYDAIKRESETPGAPSIRLYDGTTQFQINGIAPISSNFSMPVGVRSGTSGTYTISLANFNFPAGACINLYDTLTGITTDLNASDYAFALSSTDTTVRFVLNITLLPLNITSDLIQPTCAAPASGTIKVSGSNSGPWNYTWKDDTGNVIKTSVNKLTEDTLGGLSGGNYTIEVNTVGQCDNHTSVFSVTGILLPIAQFTAADTIDLSTGGNVMFTNSSVNGQSFDWSFGDQLGSSVLSDPNYSYQSAGVYSVQLIVTSNSGCTDSLTKTVVVKSNATGMESIAGNNEFILKTLANNTYVLEADLKAEMSAIYLADNSGKTITDYGIVRAPQYHLNMNLNDLKSGIYYLNVNYGSRCKTFKLIVD
jgi:PKD repeat protein